jgi:hypothetical protein
VKSLQSRWLAVLAAVPPFFVTLAAFGPLPVDAASVSGSGSTTGLSSSDRVELGIALVVLGLLIFAVTIVRLRIQARQRQSPALVGSRRMLKITDTWGGYSATPARRSAVRSLR